MGRIPGVLRNGEVGAAEAARAEFTGEQADEGELGPLADAERLKQLFPSVLQSERDRIYGADRQVEPQGRTA